MKFIDTLWASRRQQAKTPDTNPVGEATLAMCQAENRRVLAALREAENTVEALRQDNRQLEHDLRTARRHLMAHITSHHREDRT